MKAIYVKKPKSLEIVDLPTPSPVEDEVLVRVRAAGICGSDMHIYHGTNPLAEYPRIIGHEFAGEIEAIGKTSQSGGITFNFPATLSSGTEMMEVPESATMRPNFFFKINSPAAQPRREQKTRSVGVGSPPL